MRSFRVGIGYDVHPLETGARFVLGGVDIPHHKGATGHSDADVLIHAIMDALLGACGLGDIGRHFPDTETEHEGASSRLLLEKVMVMVRQNGFELSNVDATVCLQEPKIAGLMLEMTRMLAETMEVQPGQISLKATTTERLGFIGAGEGVSAYAVALVYY